ncbi:coatomer [Salix suchowensis]|nr:coatomer [Salix suchowensis]
MAKMYRLNQILDFPDPVGHVFSESFWKAGVFPNYPRICLLLSKKFPEHFSKLQLERVDKVALDALNDGAEVHLQSLEPWVQLLLDLMAFREQALRLILDLSSTVITLLLKDPYNFVLLIYVCIMHWDVNENISPLGGIQVPFPTGQTGDAGVGLLKWRMQSADESMVPLTINCWPSVSGNETFVSIEYEASSLFDLRNVMISVPLPALREPPSVRQIDGEWSGAMEFVVPPADSSSFFPISVRFSATSTYSELKVVNILPLKGGAPPKFSQRTQLVTENYQVV